ncbi:MAG: T9SS type A sorting domain-containing protein [Bacteroidales bacterium]|nr:T9SS type A sorting domain-containing protein [Bacteroidales bacterium]
MDSLTKSALYILAEQKSYPGTYIRNILQFFDTLVYIEPYVLPFEQVKTGESQAYHAANDRLENAEFWIYPNPAMSYFVAEYSIPKSSKGALELSVCDISGNVLQKIMLSGTSSHKIIGTNGLKPGLYLCKFVLNGRIKQTIKLSVFK